MAMPAKPSDHLTQVFYIDLEGQIGSMTTKDDRPTDGPLYMCNICDLWFSGHLEMLVHRSEKHMPKPTIKCERCPQLFLTEKLARDHLACAHGKEIRLEEKEASKARMDARFGKFFEARARRIEREIWEARNTDPDRRPQGHFLCFECNVYFPTIGLLGNHNMTAHLKAKFICDVCGKLYARKSTLKVHLEKCLGPKETFSCKLCGRILSNRSSVKKHMGSVHSNVRKFECDICKKRFNQLPNLRFHIKTQHNGERKYYTCSKCGKVFTALNSVRLHDIAAHQAYDCTLCYATVIGKAELREHVQSVHRNPVVKKHGCKDCTKTFGSKSNLATHRSSEHGELAKMTAANQAPRKELLFCDVCSKAYLVKASLVRHMSVKHAFVE